MHELFLHWLFFAEVLLYLIVCANFKNQFQNIMSRFGEPEKEDQPL
jgi:hypothetical protein